MEEISPPASTKSKYASFSPKKEEDQTKVDTVEISFLDPASHKLSNKEVFLDPDAWSGKSNEMRFLISADLVNLVSESHAARLARFRKAKRRLEQSRLAFLVDLFGLRGLLQRMARAAEDEQALANAQVHFFVPELYFDDYTLDCLRRASDVFLEHLLEEMHALQERLDLLGGKNWRNLLNYALKFMSTSEIGSIFMDAIPDPKTRRTVENAITRGLWDQLDELQPVVEELEEDMEDYHARFDKVQEEIARQLALISSYNERHLHAVEKLQEEQPEVPEDSASEVPEVEEEEEEEEESEEDESATSSVVDEWDEEEEIRRYIALKGSPPTKAQLKKMKKTKARDAKINKLKTVKEKKEQEAQGASRAKIKELLSRWEKRVASAQESLKALEPSLQQAEVQEVEEVSEELLEQRDAAASMEKEAAKLTEHVAKMEHKAQVLQDEVQAQTQMIQKEEEEVKELVEEVKTLPPPDPRVTMLRTLGEEQVEIMKKSKIVQAQITKIAGRIRLLKMELRELYRMLDLPWEESSDEEEEEEKPYWLRKKLAEKTSSKGFNGGLFLADEKMAILKRQKRKAKLEKLKVASLLLGKLQAQRRAQDHTGHEAPRESDVLPFKDSACPVPEGEAVKTRPDMARSLQLLKDTLETQLKDVVQPKHEDLMLEKGSKRSSDLWLESSRMSSNSILPLPGESSPQSQDGCLERPLRSRQMDFGFRPDGAGEESVESWSLFKVSKGDLEKSPTRPGQRPERPRPRVADSASYCDFGEYVSQLQQSRDLCASTPDLARKGPCLPELAKSVSQPKLPQLDWSRRWTTDRRFKGT